MRKDRLKNYIMKPSIDVSESKIQSYVPGYKYFGSKNTTNLESPANEVNIVAKDYNLIDKIILTNK